MRGRIDIGIFRGKNWFLMNWRRKSSFVSWINNGFEEEVGWGGDGEDGEGREFFIFWRESFLSLASFERVGLDLQIFLVIGKG